MLLSVESIKEFYDKIKHERQVLKRGAVMKRIPWVLIVLEAKPKLCRGRCFRLPSLNLLRACTPHLAGGDITRGSSPSKPKVFLRISDDYF
jgi:hypothetical protein